MSDFKYVKVLFAFPEEVLHPKYEDDPSLLGLELLGALDNEWSPDGIVVSLLESEAPDVAEPWEESLGIDRNLNINTPGEHDVLINDDDEGDYLNDDIFKELGLDGDDWDDEGAE